MCAIEKQTRNKFPSRWTVTNEVKAALLHIYSKTQYPSLDLCRRVADQLGVSSKQVQAWFRNQRQREKNPMWMRQLQATNYVPLASPMPLHSAGDLNQASAGAQGQFATRDQMTMNGAAYGDAGMSMPNPGYFGHPHFSTAMLPGTLPAPQLPASAEAQYLNIAQQYAMAQQAMMMSQQMSVPMRPFSGLFVPGASAPLQGQQQAQMQQKPHAQQQPQQQQGQERQLQPHEQAGLPVPPHSYYPAWLNALFTTNKKEQEEIQQQQLVTWFQEQMEQVRTQMSPPSHSHAASPLASSMEKGPALKADQKCLMGCGKSMLSPAPAAGGAASVVEPEDLSA